LKTKQASVCYSHNTLDAKKNNYPKKGPIFNGNATRIYLWKDKVFNHVMSIDVELWNIVENGINIEVNIECLAHNKKDLTEDQKQLYKKHHRCVESL